VDHSTFALRVDAIEGDGYPVQVVEPPPEHPSDRDERLHLPSSLSEVGSTLRCMGLRSLRHVHLLGSAGAAFPAPPTELDRLARRMGQDLYRALFPGPIRTLLESRLQAVSRKERRGVRLEIQVDPRPPSLAPVLRYPWELIHSPDGADFLCLDPATPLIRVLQLDDVTAHEPRSLPSPPLRVLSIPSNPDPRRRLDLQREAEALERALQGLAEIRHLARPTLRAVVDAIRENGFHVVHFMGHGAFDPRSNRGSLLLEDDREEPHPIAAETLARTLRAAPDLLLVVLNACESGASPERVLFNPFAGLATALVGFGIPAVVAMQFTISDRAAIRFSEALYAELARGESVETALTEGRLALADTPALSWEWVTPVLYTRQPGIRLLSPPEPDPEPGHPSRLTGTTRRPSLRGPIDFRSLLRTKTEEHLDRTEAKEQMSEFLRCHGMGYVFVRGGPGVGKTSFLATQAHRRGCCHHFELRSEGITGTFLRLHNLAAQFIERFSLPVSYLDRLEVDPVGTMSRVLQRVSARLSSREWIVLDLEPSPEDRQDPAFLSLSSIGLPPSLPEGLVGLVSVGEGPPPRDVAAPSITIDLSELREHESILRRRALQLAERGLVRCLLERHPSGLDLAVDALVERAGGSMLYLDLLAGEPVRGELVERSVEGLPRGLSAYLDWKWNHVKSLGDVNWVSESLPVLLALVRSSRAVRLDELMSLAGIGERARTRKALSAWSPLVSDRPFIRTAAARGVRSYALAHESVLDLVTRTELQPGEKDALRRAHLILERSFWNGTGSDRGLGVP